MARTPAKKTTKKAARKRAGGNHRRDAGATSGGATRAGVDTETRRWIRNASDEQAAAAGCRFDEARAQFVVDWIERYCRLYEGDHAGQPMRLQDWQLEATLRLFGWVRWSTEWNREIRRFRKASIWVPKKNKKSPTLAAWGLYLFCGDGEPGQKVFSCARDGKQAMISHTHAMEMVKRSPDLAEACRINKTTGRIVHLETSSFYAVISGDNIESQEGLNGSILVDETHVVDRRLMQRIRRAGISRSEPLHIEVSTAGNNPEGYGKEQFDHGAKVERGQLVDETLFYLAYAAPQDLADEQLEQNLIAVGRQANPAWGHTIKESEYVSDYQASRHSITELADFKMYRLNIWQQSANPWLRAGDWERCQAAFTEDTLAGRRCCAGLDLSRTQDMSAFVLVFPDPEHEEEFFILPYFWLPRDIAVRNNHQAPFLDWHGRGFLNLTEGNIIDYGFIKAEIRRLAKKFKIQEIAYDETFANELTQTLCDGEHDDSGRQVAKPIGAERVPFDQSAKSFAAPMQDFERLVISGGLHHNGHPVLTWQIGHAMTRRNAAGYARPVKPKQGDIRKIDGVVAGIMALARAMLKPTGSVYERRGLRTL